MGFFDSLIGGKAGKNAGNAFSQDPAALKYLENGQGVTQDAKFNDALMNYGTKGGSLKDIIGATGTGQPGELSAAMNEIATNPFSGSRFATEQVQNNGVLGQLFGKSGALDRSVKEEQDLANRGFSLKPEDYEAYGQASGNIARNFDTAESGLAQALASKGLTQSGSATRAFMGSQGNKLEQLGQMQRQIADDRMKMNMQRLQSSRNLMTSLGGQAENAIQDQFGRQVTGRNTSHNELMDSINSRQRQQQMSQNQSNQQFEQNQATEEAGLGSALGGAIKNGVVSGVQGGISSGIGYATGGPSGAITNALGGGVPQTKRKF